MSASAAGVVSLRDERRVRLGACDRGARRALKILWAGPASILGLVLTPFFRRRKTSRGVLLCEGASWPRKLGWRYRAITFGHVVLCVDDIDEKTMCHELVHVAQYERWGILYFPAYTAASLWAAGRGGHYYRDNPFEVWARRGADVALGKSAAL